MMSSIFLVLYNLASDDNSKSSSTSSYSSPQSQSDSPPAEPAYTVPAELAYTPPSEPEFGYISLAVGTESDYWTFALHYTTQQEAHNKVRDLVIPIPPPSGLSTGHNIPQELP